MSDLDLKLTVGIDKEALVKSFVNGFKDAQREVEKEDVTYTLKPDKASFMSEVKSLLSSTPDLNKDIKITLDDSSFKKGLIDVEKYSGKTARSITSSFKKEFQTEFSKGDSLYLDNILGLSEGQNKSSQKVVKKVREITSELSKYTNFSQDKNGNIKIGGIDLSKVSNYKDLERVVSLTKELDAILKQTTSKGYKVDFVDRKDLEDSVKNLQSGYSKAISQYGDSYKSQLESMKSETTDTFSQLKDILLNVFLGFADQAISEGEKAGEGIKNSVENAVDGISNSISNEVQQGVEASKKHLKDLENQLENIKKQKDEISKGTDQQSLYNNLAKAKKTVNDALANGDAVNEKDAQAYVDAMQKLTAGVAQTKGNAKWEQEIKDYTSAKQDLGDAYISPNKMETRLGLLRQLSEEERKINQQIAEENGLIEEGIIKQQEATEAKVSTAEVTESQTQEETKININEEEAIESINKIREALKELSDSEIEIKTKLASDYINDIQSQLDGVEPKPTIEVKAKIISSDNSEDNMGSDQINKVVEAVEESTKISLEDSTNYVNKLKKGLIEIAGLSEGVNFSKQFGTDSANSELAIFEGEINKIIQLYPELAKFRDVFTNNKEGETFVNTDEWNNFLATLPQAKTYLESIGYSFDKSENEVSGLDKVKEAVETITTAVQNKNNAFDAENTKVSEVVQSEIGELQKLEDKIKDVNGNIKNIDKLEETNITLTPKLSNDFNSKIQSLIDKQTFEIKVTPTTVTEEVANQIKDEKIFENVISNTISEFRNGAKFNPQTTRSLKDQLKDMLITGDIDSSKFFDTVKNDAGYVTSMFGSSYSDIKSKIRKSKIKYSDTDRAEFGDDWSTVQELFGRGVLSKSEGEDPEIFIRELAKQYSEVSAEGINNTQDALRTLYEYLSETPQKYAEAYEQSREQYAAQEEVGWNEKLQGIADNTKVPTKYQGKYTAKEYDDDNAAYDAMVQDSIANNDKLVQSYLELEEAKQSVLQETSSATTSSTSQEIADTENLIERQNELAEAMEKVDQERTDDIVETTNTEEQAVSQQAESYTKLAEEAQKTAEAKQAFADSNGEVLSSIISSLSALNSEGEGFKNLNSVIKNLANNKDDRITNLINNLNSIYTILQKPVNDSSFIKAINNLAKQGEGLRDLAAGLKASRSEIEKSQNNTTQKTKDTTKNSAFNQSKKSTQSTINNLSKRISKLGNQDLVDELNQITVAFNNVGDSADKLKNVSQSLSDLSNKTINAEENAKILATNASTLTNNYKELTSLYKQLKSTSEGSDAEGQINTRINELNTANEALEKYTYTEQQEEKIARARASAQIALKASIDAQKSALEKSNEETDEAAEAEERARQKSEGLRTSLLAQASALKNNGKLMGVYGDEIDEMISELSNTGVAEDRLNSIRNRLREIKAEADQTGNTGKTFWQQLSTRFQSLATYLSSFASFYKVVEVLRKAYTNVQELNTQMIELAKVSEQTFTQIKGDFSSYAEVAKDLGATISDTISATSDWSRMGYNIPDSKELARVALLYKNVGDGIDITSANESLISTLQGYQMTADESEHIIDVFNEVANNYAIDTAGIGEALQRSASSLNAANTSLEQSVALVTAANTVVQNPETVGTAFKTNFHVFMYSNMHIEYI